jgi:hypothetical protein
MESLHNRGYNGEELIKKLAQVIANLKHSNTDRCTDEEGMFMDRLILNVLGSKRCSLRLRLTTTSMVMQ